MHIPAEVAKTTCNLKSSFSPQPKLLVTASYGIEPGRRVEYIPLVEKALELSTHKPHKVLSGAQHSQTTQSPHLQPAQHGELPKTPRHLDASFIVKLAQFLLPINC